MFKKKGDEDTRFFQQLTCLYNAEAVDANQLDAPFPSSKLILASAASHAAAARC
jgi:hypothetical protein